jgi:hypothetical protein
MMKKRNQQVFFFLLIAGKSLVPHSLHAEKKASSSNKNPPVKLGCNAKSRMFSRIPSDSRLSI